MPSQSEVERDLNQRFPSAEAFVVVDLAARVAMGKARMDQVCGTLRDMGYEEQAATAAPAHVDVPPDVMPVEHHGDSRSRRVSEPAPQLAHRPLRIPVHGRASSAAPGARPPMPASAGGEHRQPLSTDDRRLSSAPPEAVARWADAASRNLPSQPINVAEWQGGVAPSSPSPPRASSGHAPQEPRRHPMASVEASTRQPAEPVSAAATGYDRAWASPPAAEEKGESAPTASSPVAAASPPRGRGIAASPSGGSASGAAARSRTSDPAARAPKPAVDAAAADVAAAGDGVILYMTTMTGDRMVRDRVRHFERQLFLHSIPYHPMDVSENRFVRKQIVRMCGGVDRGLPLLFVGDRCVGTYDEVQTMVDDEVFLQRLSELGWTHPDLKKAAEASQPAPTTSASPPPPQLSPAASPARHDPAASLSLASPLAGSRGGAAGGRSSFHSRHSAERAEEAAVAAASAPPQHSPTFDGHRSGSGPGSLSRSGRGPILSPSPSASGVSTHRPSLGGSAGGAAAGSPHHRHSGGGHHGAGGPASSSSPTGHPRRDSPLYSPPPLPERRSAGRVGPAAGSLGAEPHARTTWTAQGGMSHEDRLQRWHRLL